MSDSTNDQLVATCSEPVESASQHGARLVRLSDVEPEEVRWLWQGRIPLGKLTILDGDPGTSKTTLALDLAARLSRGAEMPDGAESDLEGARGVVLLTAEDGLADTIRPRLEGARADVDRIVALPLISNPDGTERMPTVGDVEALREAIEAVNAALVIFDPLAAYLGTQVDSHRDASVRAALGELAQLAENTGVAVLAIRHLNKKTDISAMYRGMGSIAFTASARSVLLVATDPEDPSGTRRVLATVKCNLAEAPDPLAYRPEVDSDDHLRISWLGPSPHGADDLLRGQPGHQMSKQEQAGRWLRAELSDGAVKVNDLKERAEQLGISWRTVRRAADALGIETNKDGFEGPWLWSLSDARDLATLDTQDDDYPGGTASSAKASTPSDDGQVRNAKKEVNSDEHGHLRKNPDESRDLSDSSTEDGQESEVGVPAGDGSQGGADSIPGWLVDGDWV